MTSRTRRGWVGLALVAAGVVAVEASGLRSRLFAQEPARAGSTAGRRPDVPGLAFAGQGTCVSCHATAESGLGFESAFPVWAADQAAGSHAQATAVLFEERSTKMVRLLYQAKGSYPAATRLECLTCHGLGAPGVARGKGAAGDEGVSCEACHGPAARLAGGPGWLDRHYLPDWKARSVGYPSAALVAERAAGGYWDQRSLGRRAGTCIPCHATGGVRGLDHAMLAAGHPDVSIEVSRDLAAAPVHWRAERSYLQGEDAAAHRARLWAVGQAVAVREALAAVGRFTALARRGRLDFAAYRCEACHHGLAPTDLDEVRVGEPTKAAVPSEALALARQRDKATRTEAWSADARRRGLGEPPLDARSVPLVVALGAEVWGDGSPRQKAFAEGLAALVQMISLHGTADLDKAQIEAKKLELLAEQLTVDAERRLFSAQLRGKLLARLGDPAVVGAAALQGFRGVEQAGAALEALSGGRGAEALVALRRHLYDGADDLARAPRGASARPDRFDATQAAKLLEQAAKAALAR